MPERTVLPPEQSGKPKDLPERVHHGAAALALAAEGLLVFPVMPPSIRRKSKAGSTLSLEPTSVSPAAEHLTSA
jgi:hypothetical protein